MEREKQRLGCSHRLKVKVRKVLVDLAGNELVDMLLDILNHEELHRLQEQSFGAFRRLSHVVNDSKVVKPVHRHHFIRPLRLAGFSLGQVKDFGFNVGDLLKSIEIHRSIAQRQRSVYSRYRNDPAFLRGKILIDIDYKEKIVLGEGPRLLNADFFECNKKRVNCLGFGVYYLDKSKSEPSVSCLNIDVISDYERQKATDVIRVFKHLMELPEFKQVDEPYYALFIDCGKQFRCSEINHFLFNELTEKGKCVNLNFFAEKHGWFEFILNLFLQKLTRCLLDADLIL
jgi:hypothetical protein